MDERPLCAGACILCIAGTETTQTLAGGAPSQSPARSRCSSISSALPSASRLSTATLSPAIYNQPVLAVSFSFPFSRFVRFQFEIERPMIIERLKRCVWLVVVVCRNGGAFAVVPGTHRLPHGPWETLGRSFRSTMTLDAELDELQMPNWFKFGARDSF